MHQSRSTISRKLFGGSFRNIVALTTFLSFASCAKKDLMIGPGGPPLSPVTGLRAYSAATDSVGLIWTQSASIQSSEADDYQITAKSPGGLIITTVNVPKSATTDRVGGLTEGTPYTFEVVLRAIPNASSSSNSPVASIVWSAAKRLETEGGSPIRVYETSSTVGVSGLVFLYPGTSGPKTVPIAGSDSVRIDVYVKTENAAMVSIKSASLRWSGGRVTRFSSITDTAASLDYGHTAPPDTSTYSSSNILVFVDTTSVSTSKILYFKGNDGNYGRLLLKRNPANSTLLWGSSPDRYLTVALSYQSTPENPYAKRK